MAAAGPRPLFSPRGIPVRAEASLWVIAALVTWSFWSRFTTTFTGTEAIAMALVATALFLLSILAHELAHALEARRRGLAVEDITLYVFGGATRIVSEASRAADELLLTVVGPWILPSEAEDERRRRPHQARWKHPRYGENRSSAAPGASDASA
jgi:Zn-dependent protease